LSTFIKCRGTLATSAQKHEFANRTWLQYFVRLPGRIEISLSLICFAESILWVNRLKSIIPSSSDVYFTMSGHWSLVKSILCLLQDIDLFVGQENLCLSYSTYSCSDHRCLHFSTTLYAYCQDSGYSILLGTRELCRPKRHFSCVQSYQFHP